jgi:excisionase family DNA binding protein
MDKVQRDREVLTAEQAADLLQMSPYGVRQLARSRRLPAVKVGREWRFLQSELLHWLREPPKVAPPDEGSAWLEVAAEQVAEALEQVEGDTPAELRLKWLEAMAKAARPARYVPGRGLVVQ